jgi:hypothetical protein
MFSPRSRDWHIMVMRSLFVLAALIALPGSGAAQGDWMFGGGDEASKTRLWLLCRGSGILDVQGRDGSDRVLRRDVPWSDHVLIDVSKSYGSYFDQTDGFHSRRQMLTVSSSRTESLVGA